MAQTQATLSAADRSHPQYLDGKKYGRAGDTTRRGIMAFGSGFATGEDYRKVRLWLAGFEVGEAEAEEEKRAPKRSAQFNEYQYFDRDGDCVVDANGMRRPLARGSYA